MLLPQRMFTGYSGSESGNLHTPHTILETRAFPQRCVSTTTLLPNSPGQQGCPKSEEFQWKSNGHAHWISHHRFHSELFVATSQCEWKDSRAANDLAHAPFFKSNHAFMLHFVHHSFSSRASRLSKSSTNISGSLHSNGSQKVAGISEQGTRLSPACNQRSSTQCLTIYSVVVQPCSSCKAASRDTCVISGVVSNRLSK